MGGIGGGGIDITILDELLPETERHPASGTWAGYCP